MRLRPAALPVAALVAAVALTGCGSSAGTTKDGKLAVVATTTQVADFVRNVGGDDVSVTQILKPNVDAHTYEPSPADINAVSQARVLVRNGAGLEHWLDDITGDFHGENVDTSKGISLLSAGGEDDPHIWQSVPNAEIMVRNITQGLIKADSKHKAAYQENSKKYLAQLEKLDAQIKREVNSIPADDRKLVTNHDAFDYYAKRYRIQVVGAIIPSFDTNAELGSGDIDAIVDKIKKTHTPAIFSETSLPEKTAKTIGHEAHVKVVAGEDSLYGDALGPKGSEGDTYLKAMRHNTDTIVNALGGTVEP
ncbi:MAG TPA: metal ABC transporter substrate-binding protein [Mycobacteriales bacterium]|nr:metal ABC transporter substrate-binding protein [Mycobacteriales bacterium]